VATSSACRVVIFPCGCGLARDLMRLCAARLLAPSATGVAAKWPGQRLRPGPAAPGLVQKKKSPWRRGCWGGGTAGGAREAGTVGLAYADTHQSECQQTGYGHPDPDPGHPPTCECRIGCLPMSLGAGLSAPRTCRRIARLASGAAACQPATRISVHRHTPPSAHLCS